MRIELPSISLEGEEVSDFENAIRKEWLVTNGLGGYASSTALGIHTRKYHGLLVAAFNPPVDRRVLLSKFDEEIRIVDETYQIGSNDFRNTISPKGYRFLRYFSLDPLPVYTYATNGVQLQKTIFMPHGKNVTIVLYQVTNFHDDEIFIRISPLISSRHFHTVTDRNRIDWNFIQKPFEQGVAIQPSIPKSTLIIFSNTGQYQAESGNWIERMYYRAEDFRGEECLDDVFQPGSIELHIDSEEKKEFYLVAVGGKSEKEAERAFSSILQGSENINALYSQELKRLEGLLEVFQDQHAGIRVEDWLKWLILAADSFVVDRKSTGSRSVIAGYPWFEDWGRDALISLPGLTLVTKRFVEAREILLTFKQYCHRGIIPNRFPDQAGDKPVYNTVDATLWFFNAVLQYLKYTGDFDFVKEELWDMLQDIIEHHVQGTSHDIHMDDDGLLKHGPQLTWMDAKVNDQIITPRNGKAVEIQALWYNALKTMELLAMHLDQKQEAEEYCDMARKAKASFARRFWNPKKGFLYDVVHNGDEDSSLRPNQIMAVSLDFSMLSEAKQEAIVETVWKKLWGMYGLHTLSNDDARYVGQYTGDRVHRDHAYHNGTVWAWLLGPFTTAFLRVKNHDEPWRRFALENFLKPLFQKEVFQAGLGTISEIFDGDSPHPPRGCIAQAWSVAEPLRAFVEEVLLRRPIYEGEVLRILSSMS